MNWIKLTKDNLPKDRETILIRVDSKRTAGIYLDRFINQFTECVNLVITDDGGMYRMDLHEIFWLPYPKIIK